jgi:hypothetical protein
MPWLVLPCRAGLLFVVEQKEAKSQHKGFAPMYPEGQGRPVYSLPVPETLQPEILVLSSPMVKGGEYRRMLILLHCAQ